MRRLTKKQAKHLDMCLEMADKHMLITPKTFAVAYGEDLSTIKKSRTNKMCNHLNTLMVKGYMERNGTQNAGYVYVLMTRPDGSEYTPPLLC